MNNQHSPLPWALGSNASEIISECPPGFSVSVADCRVSYTLGEATMASNAAFIVCACNAHAVLLGALQNILMCAASDAPCEDLEDAQRDLRLIHDIAGSALCKVQS